MNYFISILLPAILILSFQIRAAGIRDHTRPNVTGETQTSETRISETQAGELTLTLVQADQYYLQTWLRMAASPGQSARSLIAKNCSANAELIQPGQRVRAFTADSKSSIYRATVTDVFQHNNCVTIKAILSSEILQIYQHYVMEIVIQRGQLMSVPKEAIIEEGEQQIVYVQKHPKKHPGHYFPQQIHTGIKGELYTEVTDGLNVGDQVVTLGSFFIDAEYKLKKSSKNGASHAHQHH